MINDSLVYLSVGGEERFIPLSEASIPVLDRGFIFGDGVYEVVPVYAGVPFRLAEHFARLTRSLAAISIAAPFDRMGFEARMKRLLADLGQSDQFVYLQITRGVAKRGHAFPKEVVPTVFMMTSPLVLPTASVRETGVSAVTAKDNRWLRCDIKSVSLLGNVLMAQHAAEQGVTETIMFRDGSLTEGSSSNVWVVIGNELLAPPRDTRILEGIRYGLIESMAQAEGITFSARPVSEDEVRQADELLISSATKEVLPVTTLDGKPVGQGRPGPVYERLYAAYQRAKAEAREASGSAGAPTDHSTASTH